MRPAPQSLLRRSLLALMLLGGLAMAYWVLFDPWTLVAEPEWLGPTRLAYHARPAISLLGLSLGALGVFWLLLPKKGRWEWGLFLLALVLAVGAWSYPHSLERPVFMG